MDLHLRLGVGVAAALSPVLPAAAEKTPKRGGTLIFMIPADAPPSFDAHRETTYATIHSAAPFYSVLMRVNQRSYVKGRKIGPSHYVNQDLATVWLDK